jgi:hypothetical protein
MSEDNRIDEIIRSAAGEYNRPPEVPRDEMWAAIQAARSEPGPRLHVAAGSAAAGYAAKRIVRREFAWIGMAAAAALLVATGIGIGRLTNRSTSPVATRPGVTVIADAPPPVQTNPDDEIGSAKSAATEPAATEPAATEPGRSQPASQRSPSQPSPSQRTRDDIRRNPTIIGKGRVQPVSGRQLAGLPQSNIYQVATARHLADAEILLTSFSLGSRDTGTNTQFADWAKGLLSNTRLLLDSPAGDDPRRAKLLQDLELVLAQIVQLAPDARAEDRQLVEGSIQQAHVMTRLRTAIPADQPIENLERR